MEDKTKQSPPDSNSGDPDKTQTNAIPVTTLIAEQRTSNKEEIAKTTINDSDDRITVDMVDTNINAYAVAPAEKIEITSVAVDKNNVPKTDTGIEYLQSHDTPDMISVDPLSSAITNSGFVGSTVDILPLTEYTNDEVYEEIGMFGETSGVHSATGYEQDSVNLVSSEFVLLKGIEMHNDGEVLSKLFAKGGINHTNQEVINRAMSAGRLFVKNQVLPIYSNGQSILTLADPDIKECFITSRSIELEKRNGHPYIGKGALTGDAKVEIEKYFDEAKQNNRVVRLGETSSITSAGSRKIQTVQADVMHSSTAYALYKNRIINSEQDATTLIQQLAESLVPEGFSVTIPINTNRQGAIVYSHKLVTNPGILMHQASLNGVPELQAACISIAREINVCTGLEVSANRLATAKKAFSGGSAFGSSISLLLRQHDNNVLSDVMYASLAPHLFEIDEDVWRLDVVTDVMMLAPLIDVLTMYALFPITHKLDHIILPWLMSTIRNLDFGNRHFETHDYSRFSKVPKHVHPAKFYTENHYPLIFTEDMQHYSIPMKLIAELLRYNGEPSGNIREWDVDEKVINTAHRYQPLGSGSSIRTNFQKVTNVMRSILKDKQTSTWERKTKTDASAGIQTIISLMDASPDVMHYSGGAFAKAVASSPLTNMPLTSFSSVGGHMYNAASTLRDGYETEGHKTRINLPRGLGVTMMVAAGSQYVDEAGTPTQVIRMPGDKVSSIVGRFIALLTRGTQTAIAGGITNAIIEYSTSDLETIAPINQNFNRDYVTQNMKLLSEKHVGDEEPKFEALSVDSIDFITNTTGINALQKKRATPAVFASGAAEAVATFFKSDYDKFITNTLRQHSGLYIKEELAYTQKVSDNSEENYLSPPIKMLTAHQAEILAMCFHTFFNEKCPRTRIIKGLVMTGSTEEFHDVFGFADRAKAFDWSDFIKNKKYENAAGETVEHKPYILLQSPNDRVPIPKDYGVACIMIGGAKDGKIGSFTEGAIVAGLYTCDDIDNRGDKTKWALYDNQRKVIIQVNGTVTFKSSGTQTKNIMKKLIRDTHSNNGYPGAMVLYDPVSVFTFDSETIFPTTQSMDDQMDFYFSGEDIIKLPGMIDHYIHMKDRMTIGTRDIVNYRRFLEVSNVQKSVLALRPNAFDSAMNLPGGETNYYQMRAMHRQFDPNTFTVTEVNGNVAEPIVTSLEEFQTGALRLLHTVTAINNAVVEPIEKIPLVIQAGGILEI